MWPWTRLGRQSQKKKKQEKVPKHCPPTMQQLQNAIRTPVSLPESPETHCAVSLPAENYVLLNNVWEFCHCREMPETVNL